MFLIIGFVLVIASICGGYFMEGGNFMVLVQPAEFVIIGGAALGSMLIGTPPSILKRLVGQLKGLLGGATTKADYMELLAMLYQLFKAAQQSGVMALESHFEKPDTSPIMSKYPKFLARHHAVDFLADSVKVIIIGGIGPHDFENLMDLDLEVRHHEAAQPAATLNKVSDAMPGLGIVAAVLGVVITMGVIDGPPAEIGHKVGAALVGTFLGILMSYGFMGRWPRTWSCASTARATTSSASSPGCWRCTRVSRRWSRWSSRAGSCPTKCGPISMRPRSSARASERRRPRPRPKP
ncbi:MAG: motility-associated protein [Acidobacteriota bacterium]